MSGSVCTSFACGMCGKCYKTAGECVDHIQTHTSHRPFRCLVCWPLFTDSGDAENTQGDGQMQDMMGIQSQPHNNIQHAVTGAGHRDVHLHCMETSDSILAIHTDTADRSVSSNIEMEDRQGSLPASHTAVGSGDTAAYPASLVARDELSSFPQSPARQDWEPACSQSPIHLDKQPQSPGSALWAGQQTTLQSSIAEHTEHQRSLPRLSKLQDQLRAVPQATVEQRTEQTTPSQSPEDHYQSSGNHNQWLETETGAVLDTEPQTLSVTARDVSSLQHDRDLCASSPVRGVGKATPVRRRGKRRERKGRPRRVGCDQDTNVECEPLLDATTQHSSQGGKEQRDDHDTTGGVVSQPQSAVVAGHGDSGAGVEVSKASDPRMTSELCDANDGTSHSQTDVWSEPVVTSEHYSEPLLTSEHCNQDDRVGEFQSTVATGPLDSDLECIQVKPALSLASVMSEDDDNDGDSQVVSPVLSSCEADDASVHFDGTVGYLQSTLSCEADDGEGWVSQIQPASPPEETLLSSSSSGCNVIEMSDSGSVDEVPCTDSSRLVIQVETKSTGPNFSNVIQFLKSVSLKPGSPTKTDMLAIGLDTISDGSSKSASDMDNVSHWDQESDPLKSPAGDAATKKSTCIVTQGVQTDYDNKNSGSQNKHSVTVYRGDSCVVRKVGGQVTKSLITGASVQPRSLVITTPTCATSAPLLPASCSHQTGFSTAGVAGQLAPPSTLRSVSVASPTSTPRVVEVLCVPAYTLSPYQDHTLYHPVMRKEGSTTVSLLRGHGTGDKASTVMAGSDEASKVAAVDDKALEVTSVEALTPTAANTPLPGGDTNNSTSDPHVTITTAVSSAGSNQCVSVSQSSDTDQAQVSIIVQGLGDCGHQDFIQSACLDSGVTCNQESGECGHQDGHQDCAASDVKVCVEGGSQQHVECGHEATLSLEDLANVCAWIQRVNTEQGTLDWQTEFVEKSASSTLCGQPAGASWAIGDHDYAVLAQVADVTSQPENPVGKLTVKSSKQNDADSEKGCVENSTSKVNRQSSMQGGADPEKGHIVNPAGKVNRQTSVQSEADPEKEHMLSCVDLYHKKKLSERKTTPSATVARTRLQLKMNQSSTDEASPKNTKHQRRRKVHSSVRKRTLRSSVGADSVLLPTEDAMISANVLPSKTVVSDADHEPEPQDTSSGTTVTKMLSIVLSDISAGHSREIAPCRNQSLSRVSVTTQSPTKLRECSVTLRPIQQHECSVTQSSIQGPAPAVTDSPTQNQNLTVAKSPTRSYNTAVAASPINHDNQIVMQSPAQFCDHNGGVDKTGHVDLHSAGDDRKLPAADTEPACADGVKMPTAVVLGEEEQSEHDGGELLPDSGDDGTAVVMLTNVQSGDAGLPGLMLISTQDSVAPPTTDVTVTPPSTRGQTRHIATVTHTATRRSRVTPGVHSSKKGLQDEASPSRTRARRRVGVPMTIRGRAYMKGRSPLKRNQTVSDGVSRSRGLGMSGDSFYIAKGRLRASTLFTHPQYYRRRTTADSKQDRDTSVPSTPASGTARDGAAGPQQDNGAVLMVTVADVHSGLENQGGTALDSHGDRTAPVSALYIKSSPGNVPPADEASRNLGSTPVVSRRHLGSTPVESKLQIRLALIERGLGSMKRQRASTAGRKVADRQESKRVRCSLPTASVENRPTLRHRSATRTSPQQPSDSLRSSKNIRAGEMEQAVDISVLSEISQANDALQQSKDSAVKTAPDGGMLYKKNFSPLETSSDAIILPDDGRIHECTECTARFSNKLRLMSHMAIHESGLSNFTCDICFRTFTRQYSVKIHRMIHTREAKVDCEVCGRTLANPGNLAIHMRIHTDERPFACDLCPKTFRQQAALQSHIRTHSKERPFACEYCDKRYAFQKNLYTHRFSHTGQRPYACKLCGAAFRQMSALKVHLRAHTGEKPFKCPQCSSRFTQKSHLKKHLRHLHQPRVSEEERLAKDRLKPHRCKHCEKGFSSPFSLKRHLTEGYCTQASNFVNRRKFPYRSVL